MKRFRLRFSLKSAFLAMTLTAIAAYLAMLPSVRAKRFAKFIETGKPLAAEAMLPASIPDHAFHRRTLRHSNQAMIQPLAFLDLLRGERRVVVTQHDADAHTRGISEVRSLGENAEFVVTRGSVSAGWHSLLLW